MRALEALAHERTVARLKQESDEIGTGFNAPSTSESGYSVPYDPASVFLLETMVSIACQTPQHVEELWFVEYTFLMASADNFIGQLYLSIFLLYSQPLPNTAFF